MVDVQPFLPIEVLHANLGLLMLRGGVWNGAPLLPKEWWVWDAPAGLGVLTGPYQGAYSAMGANGQYIVVLPAIDLVMAHKVDFDEDGRREVQSHEFDAILQMVIASACTGDCK